MSPPVCLPHLPQDVLGLNIKHSAGAQAFYQAAKLRVEQGEPVEAALCWMGVGEARLWASCM